MILERPLAELAADELAAYRQHHQDPPEKPRGFHFRKVSQIEVAPPEYLIKPVIEKDSTSILVGSFGSGKSFIVQAMAYYAALGLEAFNWKPSGKLTVLFILGEGQGGIRRRFRALEIVNGLSLEDAGLFVSSSAARLGDPAFLPEAREAVDSIAEERGGVDLIIVDTWSRSLAGNENSSEDSAAAVAQLDAIRRPHKAAALVVHHTGWSDAQRSRGSTVLPAAADNVFSLEKSGDNVLQLTQTKAKESEPMKAKAFKLATVELGLQDEEGQEVTSAVAVETEVREPEKPSRRGTGKNQQAILATLADCFSHNRENLQKAGKDPEGAGVNLHQWREACGDAGMTRKQFYKAKAALIKAEKITIDEGGYVSVH
ncbi:MAG: helicase RepA family protein [Spirochaetales bacterium]|nr:helicase RepA family protein [Spirochaetales bacterium]